MNHRSRLLVTILTLATVLSAPIWAAPQNGEEVLTELRGFLKGAEVRTPGSAGNLAMEARVAKRFADSGFKHGEIAFRTPEFLPGKTSVRLPGAGAAIELLPLHPTAFRPGNFKEPKFSAPLVYLGMGDQEALARVDGQSLEGAIAVMEFASSENWLRFLRFGIRGFIFLESSSQHYHDAVTKVFMHEVSVPRFYAQGADANRLRQASQKSVQGDITAAPSRWENRDIRNLWVLIPGSDPDKQKEVAVMVAPMDSNCIVPQLAQGAQGAMSLHMLMHLFETFAAQPPARSVLLVALNGRTRSYLGERMLAWNLLVAGEKQEELRNILANEIRLQTVFADYYSKLDLSSAQNKEMEERLIELRFLEDRSSDKNTKLKDPIVALARRDVNQTKGDLLRITKNKELSDAEREAQMAELKGKLEQYVNVLTLFNKVGIRTVLGDLSDIELEVLRGYVEQVAADNRKWADLNARDLEIDTKNSEIRRQLEGRKVVFAVSLELDWSTDQIGFSSGSFDMEPSRGPGWSRRFGVNSIRVAKALREASGQDENARPTLLDTITNYAGLGEPHYFSARSYTGMTYFQVANGLPSFSLRNCFSYHGSAFTTADTVDNLNPDNVWRVWAFLPQYMSALLADDLLTNSGELKSPNFGFNSRAVHMKAYKFDEFDASLTPQLPVANSVIILYPGNAGRREYSTLVAGDVVTPYFALTDSRATAIFYDLFWGVKSNMVTGAYHYDQDFIDVDHVIDAGDVQAKTTTDSNLLQKSVEDKTLALFACREIPIYAANDPSKTSYVYIGTEEIIALGGRSNATPRKYGMTGFASLSTKLAHINRFGPGAVYIEPHETVKLLANNGTVALNASKDSPKGEGFNSEEELGADFVAKAAEDLAVLNDWRLKRFRGVTNELANDFLAMGKGLWKEVEQAKSENRHSDYLRLLYECLGAQKKAYEQLANITNDMLKAIIFYMALLLPFCFFVQKLIFKFVRIEVQMASFFVLFVGTFAVFRQIHPAFRIAEAPEAIFVAFVMGILGLFVVHILHGRFEGEMQLLFRSYVTGGATEVGYSTVGQKAMLIGVNNMKRRRIRTMLTTATIVLVTFTMLAFSGISKKMSPTMIPITKNAPYNGLFYQWPGSLQMDEASMQTLTDLYAGRAKRIVVRRWLVPESVRGAINPLFIQRTDGAGVNIDAALGMGLNDNDFLNRNGLPILDGGRYFSTDDAQEIILPAATASALQITPADVGKIRLRFMGYDLTVVGIVDDEQFRALRDINNRLIIPIKGTETSGTSSTSAENQLKIDPTTDDESSVFYAELSALMIVPVEFLKRVGGKPFSVSVEFPDNTNFWPEVERFITTTQARLFMSSKSEFKLNEDSERTTGAGVYYIGEGYKTSIGGLARLIIPLLIAGTILLNTMLGSVFERKNEIAVYNAIGLNPTHIGMFFLAEAFVYSVIGSVGGYLIGQVLSIGISNFGLVEGINLNFSSLTVVYVILFTIAIVILSTLYPAVVATRAAVPSGKRTWSLPPHDGNFMRIDLPFIYQPKLAVGIMAYLREYFGNFDEQSVGEMIVDIEDIYQNKDDKDRNTYGMRLGIALAPFDLGVTQKVSFDSAFNDAVDSYQIHMTIERISGQDSNWTTTNKPFLEKLRKLLMEWRNLDSGEHQRYVQQGQEMFKALSDKNDSAPGDAVAQPATAG